MPNLRARWKTFSVYTRRTITPGPVVCIDEKSKELHQQIKDPLPLKAGKGIREDYQYKRAGVANIFLAFEPKAGIRYAEVSEKKRGREFSNFLKLLVDKYYPHAQKIRLILDNYATHQRKILYEYFPAAEARRLLDKLEFNYTPVHASWLNAVEAELSVLSRQCLNQRIASLPVLKSVLKNWQWCRNREESFLNWQFKVEDARETLHDTYPELASKRD